MHRAVLLTAGATGHAVRLFLWLLSWVPVVAGPALVLYGTWLAYRPACYILAGLVVCTLTLVQANPRRGQARAVSSSRT